MARQRRGILIVLIVFVVVAAAIRFFGDPLWNALIRLHGGAPGVH